MEARMTDVLLKHKIFVAAGNDFGTDVSGWFRVVFAHQEKYLLEGLERMDRAIKMFGTELAEERGAGAL
jgi:bifunctional pyridoxal-dependent enzyme with beta-cystathionase and maltose regulon repressor activities